MKQVIKRLIPHRFFQAIVPYWHLLHAVVVNIRYGFPARGMHVIGVTGTNGKTTTCFMIHRMLVEAGYNTALMTTVAHGINHNISPQIAHMTTVSTETLMKRIAYYRKQGVEWLVLETTSHALAQYRTWGVPYEIAVVTNISHEHLDYHGSFARYRAAKRRLFELASRHGRRLGIVNADDTDSADFCEKTPHRMSYGVKAGDIRASDIRLESDGSMYTAVAGEQRYQITCHIPGEFNIYNSLAAVAVGRALELTSAQIEQGIAALEGVEGRMDTVDEGQAFAVVVDFAHTPDSFERLLGDLRRSTKGKLVVLFGSAGRRDEAKRALQGEIAGKYGDEVIITEEDDRDCDGREIMEQIATGAEKAGKARGTDLYLVHDRSEAIRFAMTRAQDANDTVVLLGKGHEKTIERADGEHAWDELAEARAALSRLD